MYSAAGPLQLTVDIPGQRKDASPQPLSPPAGSTRGPRIGRGRRLTQAPRDAGFALEYVKKTAKTQEQREAVCTALIFKTNVLWVQLDALYHAYVDGHIPPGAFVPER